MVQFCSWGAQGALGDDTAASQWSWAWCLGTKNRIRAQRESQRLIVTPLDAVFSNDATGPWRISTFPTDSPCKSLLPCWDRSLGRDASRPCSSPVCLLPLQRASASRQRRKHQFSAPLQQLRVRWSQPRHSHWALWAQRGSAVPGAQSMVLHWCRQEGLSLPHPAMGRQGTAGQVAMSHTSQGLKPGNCI